ncbi:MAG TPA: DUF3325 family protein [Burkholderiaceae bacterium]|nr:DUF3325 family protein [Burkholderiaceae bacterium]
MRELLAMPAACFLALLGFALLALSQERHLAHVFAPTLPPQSRWRALRAAGFAAVGACLPVCIASEGAGFGSLLWVVLIGAAATAIALTLTWRPHWLRYLHLPWFNLRP